MGKQNQLYLKVWPLRFHFIRNNAQVLSTGAGWRGTKDTAPLGAAGRGLSARCEDGRFTPQNEMLISKPETILGWAGLWGEYDL